VRERSATLNEAVAGRTQRAAIVADRLAPANPGLTSGPQSRGELSGCIKSYLFGKQRWQAQRWAVPERIGSSMPNDGRFIALAASAILLSVVSLVPLSSRAEEPGRPKTTAYPDVEHVPARPEKPAMTADEQLKLKKDLSATRDRQAPKGKSGAGASKP
jgi:hypothetical protein